MVSLTMKRTKKYVSLKRKKKVGHLSKESRLSWDFHIGHSGFIPN